jgi:lysophospholipase L1-like esterase
MTRESKKIILVIGSSMTMPRLEVKFDETWLCSLFNYLPDYIIIDKSRRASTSERLINDGAGQKDIRRGADLLEYYNPSFVITQIGITDCAPRLLNKKSVFTKLLNSLPNFIKKRIYSFLKNNIKRKIENSDVNLLDFKKNWTDYLERALKIKTTVLAIKISKATSIVKEKSPEIETAINLYNGIYDELADEFSNFHILEPFTQEEINKYAIDEFHVSKEGHKALFKKIKLIMNQIVLNE